MKIMKDKYARKYTKVGMACSLKASRVDSTKLSAARHLS